MDETHSTDASARLGGIVLAAGASSRMGQPKAMLDFEGSSFLEHAVAGLRALGADPIVVVFGAHALEIPPPALGIEHPGWRDGPTTSLQVGLDFALRMAARGDPAAPSTLAAVAVHTVDRPRIRRSTMRALAAAWQREPTGLWQPRHEGRGGHPMIWPRATFASLLEASPETTRRDLARGPFAGSRRFVDVDDPGIHDNVDTPRDLGCL